MDRTTPVEVSGGKLSNIPQAQGEVAPHSPIRVIGTPQAENCASLTTPTLPLCRKTTKKNIPAATYDDYAEVSWATLSAFSSIFPFLLYSYAYHLGG